MQGPFLARQAVLKRDLMYMLYPRKRYRNQMQRSQSKRGTQCMFLPVGLPLFSDQLLFGLLKIK